MKYILSVFSLLLLMNSGVFAKTMTYGPENSKTRILIAMEKTKFKSELVEKMLVSLNDGTNFITVVDHKKNGLKDASSTNFNVVFITGSGAKAKVRPWILSWIDEQPVKDNIILHTTQLYDWEVKVDVDVITSASDRKSVDTLAETYVNKINESLKK